MKRPVKFGRGAGLVLWSRNGSMRFMGGVNDRLAGGGRRAVRAPSDVRRRRRIHEGD